MSLTLQYSTVPVQKLPDMGVAIQRTPFSAAHAYDLLIHFQCSEVTGQGLHILLSHDFVCILSLSLSRSPPFFFSAPITDVAP